MPRKPKRPKKIASLGLKTSESSGKVYYVSSVDAEVYREEWATIRIIELLDQSRSAEAKAVALEQDIEWLDV